MATSVASSAAAVAKECATLKKQIADKENTLASWRTRRDILLANTASDPDEIRTVLDILTSLNRELQPLKERQLELKCEFAGLNEPPANQSILATSSVKRKDGNV